MNGADAILRSLEAEGVEVIFGLPGGAILPLYDAMARGTTVRHVLARHEQGAGHMAEGYARASGRVGVAVATSGPGGQYATSPTSYVWVRLPPSEIALGRRPYFSLRKRSFIGSDSGNSDAKSRAASLSRSVARSTASLTLIWIFMGATPRTPLAAVPDKAASAG